MCVYSMVSGHYYGRWPVPTDFPPAMFPDYAELVRKAKAYDELMKQNDCPDPKKQAWEEAVRKFMKDKYGLDPKWTSRQTPTSKAARMSARPS